MLTILIFARLWCGVFCTLGLFVDIGNKIRKGRLLLPKIFLVSLPYIFFILFAYWHEVAGIYEFERLWIFSSEIITTTLLVFLGLFSLGLIAGILMPRRSFCEYLCPLGLILGTFSRLSFLTLRTRKEICARCTTFECLKGTKKADPCPVFINVPKIDNNHHCLMCGNCVKNCPYDSPRLKFRTPGKELLEGADPHLSESLFIMAFLGVMFMLVGGEILEALEGAIGLAVGFALAIPVFIALYAATAALAAKLSGLGFKTALTKFGYIYLPLLYFTFIFHLFEDELGLHLASSVKLVLLTIGILWSLWLAKRLMGLCKVSFGKFCAGSAPLIALLLAIGAMLWFFVVIAKHH